MSHTRTTSSKAAKVTERHEKARAMIAKDSGSDLDDLDITRNVRKELTGPESNESILSQYIDEVVGNASDTSEQGQLKEEGERLEWSDDDDDGQATYEAFKNRRKDHKKRATANTKKTKEAINGPQSKQTKSLVGKRKQRIIRDDTDKPKKRARIYGEESDLDELMDEVMPEYIKKRKANFEEAKAKLGESGLKLPPEYDDLAFSGDERMDKLKEKPVFENIKPQREYKDTALPASAGIIPAPIAQWLRDYQVEGVEFLHELYVYQRGGILGDDMGLGKTIQVISFLTAAFGKTGDERDAKRMRKVRKAGGKRAKQYPKVLIVCPGTLMANWNEELKRWGYWSVFTFHGSTETKDNALKAASSGYAEIVITTYTTFRMNKDAINMIAWDCVIADECHIIKGQDAEVTKAMNSINALCRIGLTGTAIQNKYDELFALLNWTNPGTFGSLAAWRECISDPLKIGQSHDATVPQLAKARKTANSLVNALLPRFFLRRMKSLIAHQLPKKSDRVVFCPLTTLQAEAYTNLVESEFVEYIRNSADLCECGSGKKRGWCCFTDIPDLGPWQKFVFPCMMQLQKLANHLALLVPSNSDTLEKQYKDTEMLKRALPDRYKELVRQKDSIESYNSKDHCGKWKVLRHLLHYWHGNGDKVLIFSDSVRLLKMLRMLFQTTAYNVSYLDGQMKYEDRAQAVSDFNNDPLQFVFLISTKAGGTGLNITSANKVVVFDPNWNPAHDLQAQDRAYRIGQLRNVEVFRLISVGTIEEIVYARQIYKQQQANIAYNASLERRYFKGVQDKREMKGEIFGLHNMFTFNDNTLVLRDIVNKTNVAEAREGVSVVALDPLETGADDQILNEEAEEEDSAISQLAKLIENDKIGAQGEKVKSLRKSEKTDAISAILNGAGVKYTHDNAEVIGSSKVETKLSRRALELQNDLDMTMTRVFHESDEDDVREENAMMDRGVSLDRSDGENGEDNQLNRIHWKYRPSEGVRARQFCTMAKTFGFKDSVEFALVVEGWTQEQRRSCLERFYRRRAKHHFTSG